MHVRGGEGERICARAGVARSRTSCYMCEGVGQIPVRKMGCDYTVCGCE